MKTTLKVTLASILGLLLLQASPQVASASDTLIEGKLVGKLYGELDPYVLGDACVTWIEYFDARSESPAVVGILENREDYENCLGAEIAINDEIDFDLARLESIRPQHQLKLLRSLAGKAGVEGEVAYFEYTSK